MSQGRRSVIRALVALSIVVTVPAVEAQTVDGRKASPLVPVCRPTQNITDNEALVSGGYVGADGKVHFTFAIEPTADAIQVSAFRKAVDQWNDLSHVSWMMLEPGPLESADIKFGLGQFEFKEDGTTPKIYCGKHDPNESSIRHHPSNMKFAGSAQPLAVRVYAHEIGH